MRTKGTKKPYQISIRADLYDAAKRFVDGKPEYRGVQRGGQATFSVGRLAEKLIVAALDTTEGAS